MCYPYILTQGARVDAQTKLVLIFLISEEHSIIQAFLTTDAFSLK